MFLNGPVNQDMKMVTDPACQGQATIVHTKLVYEDEENMKNQLHYPPVL